MKGKKLKKSKPAKPDTESPGIYGRIRKIIEDARGNIARTINTEMATAYWQIGKVIVEEEQRGKLRAGYGEEVLKNFPLSLQPILVKDSTSLICVTFDIFIFLIQNVTRCVTN